MSAARRQPSAARAALSREPGVSPPAARPRPAQARPRAAPSAWDAIALHGPLLQRACSCGETGGGSSECEECATGPPGVQRSAAGTAPAVAPPIVHDVLRSAGRPLDPGTRAFFGARLGQDLGSVRVHSGARAAASARAVNARAYTVGRNIVFGDGRYRPETVEGRRLLAHELTHVVQQRAAGAIPSRLAVAPAGTAQERAAEQAGRALGTPARTTQPSAPPSVQRDLVTPEPAEAPAAQPELTDEQIRAAIRFNSQHYDAANTRIIQQILGGPVTGRWTSDNIVAIAATQEQYGLRKDGKVGADTFEFIQDEQRLEGAGTRTRECLTMFRVIVHPSTFDATPGPGGRTRIGGHHVVQARFSTRCDCSEFQYRQFIAGTALATRPSTGGVQDLANLFGTLPGGRLPVTEQEDGMTQCAGVNYGHREQPGEARTGVTCAENQYRDAAGTPDQARGCVYRGEDFPKITVDGLQSGDIVDLLVQFRGEIQRNGTVVQTRRWTTIERTVVTP